MCFICPHTLNYVLIFKLEYKVLQSTQMKVSIIYAEITMEENLLLTEYLILFATHIEKIILTSHLLEEKIYFFTENNPLAFFFS